MRRHRTIYFNDARHYYLFVFEPPMRLEDAWRPVDEVAGTSVDTFVYGVERSDGLFYDTKVGLRWGADKRPFKEAYEWRTWENMQSLIDRGLDPLRVLVDRAHQKNMSFFASLRMGGGYGGLDPAHRIGVPGARSPGAGPRESHADYAHAEVREVKFAVLRELATGYPVEGLELDFAFTPFYFKPEEAGKHTWLMTDYVRSVSEMVRGRPGEPGMVGARVFPTEEMCLRAGLDVRTWLRGRLVDFVVPLLYGYNMIDPEMPIDWLIQAAHTSEASVYGMLNPYYRRDDARDARSYATPAMVRAAAANLWDRGVDGLYTWFLSWPLGVAERGVLTELGDPELVKEGDKHYALRRRSAPAAELGYDATLPLGIPRADPDRRYEVPFYVADDVEGAGDRIREVQLNINVRNLVSSDAVTVYLNGQPLSNESCARISYTYEGQWLEYRLERVRPRKGQNLLEISLVRRPRGLEGGVTVEDVEVLVQYAHPAGFTYRP